MAKFLQDTSLIILFFLSIADICITLITQTLFAVLIGRFFDQICTLDIIAQFFAVFLTYVSGYGIACFGFDVYARMCFPKRNHLMVTKKRLFAALTFICLISFFQGIFYALGTQYNVFEYASKVVVGIDSVVIFLVILTQILAVKVAKDHSKNSENRTLFSKFDWMLTKFVSKILRVWFSFLVTYFVISVCFLLLNKKEKDGESWLNFALHCGYLLSYFNSVFNALIFLKMNKSQNLKIHVFCRNVRARPQDPVRCRRQDQENVS